MTPQAPLGINALLEVSKKRVGYSYHSMARANRFFVYYFLSYHQLYNVSIRDFLNRCGPMVNHVFSLVNEADELIEAAQRGEVSFSGVHPWIQYTADLINLLKELDIYEPIIARELSDNLIRYWELENHMMHDKRLTHSMLIEAIDLRASDITATHYICERILSLPLNADRIEATRACEILMEIECDLTEYITDIHENNYNSYRMFVRLYGNEAPQYVEQERERRIQVLRKSVATLPKAEQDAFKAIFLSWDAFYKDRYGTFTYLKNENYHDQFFFPRAIIPRPILEP